MWGKLSVVFAVFVLSVTAFAQTVWYVDVDQSANLEDGTSWNTAYVSIQAAIDAAVAAGANASTSHEIWVAEGAYTSTADPVVTMKEGVNLYGGFTGTESVRGERDSVAHVTKIDGQNARRCVTGANHVTLDGFTIFSGSTTTNGGGMYNDSVSPTVTNCSFVANTATNSGGAGMYNNSASPLASGCTFSQNTATYGGGGIYNNLSSPTVTNCTFSKNTSIGDNFHAQGGGGMYSTNSSPSVSNCIFTENTARAGGGMDSYLSSSFTVSDCTFSKNTASIGGGMDNYGSSPTVNNCTFTENIAYGSYAGGGGMYSFSGASPTITNCIFTRNTASGNAGHGGGMYNYCPTLTITNCVFAENTAVGNFDGMDGGAIFNYSYSPIITNCTFTKNSAPRGSAMYNSSGASPKVTNCIFWADVSTVVAGEIFNYGVYGANSAPVVAYSCIYGGYTGLHNIAKDPWFVDEANGDYRLKENSPCIDSGTSTDAPSTDILGVSRPQDQGIDMGAYEGAGGPPEPVPAFGAAGVVGLITAMAALGACRNRRNK